MLERARQEFLEAGGESRPPYDILDADITDAAATAVLRGRIDDLPDDSIIEIDTELMLVSSVDVDTPGAPKNTANFAARGYLDSVAAAHVAGARVYLDPPYPTVRLLNALRAIVAMLYPWGVYDRNVISSLDYASQGVLTFPAGTLRVLGVLVSRYGGETGTLPWKRLEQGKHWEWLPEFDPPKAQFLMGGAQGRDLQVVYAKDFDFEGIALSTNLTSTTRVPARIQQFLPLAVAGYVLQGEDVPRLLVDEIRDALAALGAEVPPGTAINIGRVMLDFFRNEFVSAERKRLQEQDPTRYEYVGS